MDIKRQRQAAAAFASKWAARGYEKGDTAPFWLEFLRECLGVADPDAIARFEQRTDAGYPDVTIPDTGVIIEQKSLGVDLDRPEPRQGRQVTPYEQALGYAQSLPPSQQPRFIITCNFQAFRIYDRELDQSGQTYTQVELAELPGQIHLFDFITDPSNSRIERERQVSIEAGALIGELHHELLGEYIDPESDASQHSLNVLCVRLVFLLFAEDAGILGQKSMFLDYLKDFNADQTRKALLDLFEVLDTPEDERGPYLPARLAAFPYVNGGLFEEPVEIPNFTEDIRFLLLFKLSQETDWSGISPTVFGGVFESTLNPDTRASGGMHYTSVENIRKLIGPLFLDALASELDDILASGLSGRTKSQRLKAYQEKIAGLRFLDPACGSGNFLTETYICLRRLENRALMHLQGGQGVIGFAGLTDVKVSLSQFYGIEINDFAVRVANTALWIAELQANIESESVIQRDIQDLPLSDSANIVLANALRTDWDDVLPASECDYVMGNPPFIGYSNHTAEQKEDRANIFGKAGGVLDYVACWYKKASDYIAHHPVHCAFVSTNSICQGQQVAVLWQPLFADGIEIDFAWRTFVWYSEATDLAHVHVVIIGFSRSKGRPKLIFDTDGTHEAPHINAYLIDAPNAFIERRAKPLCDVPLMVAGGKPTDGGNLLMTPEERGELLSVHPELSKWTRPFSMGEEFINGKDRYCFWFVGITPKELRELPQVVRTRIAAVKEMRLASPKEPTRQKAETPWLFDEVRPPEGEGYIAIPKVSSERRQYIPIGFVDSGMIPGDKLFYIENADLYDFGILTSQFHNAWMRVVAGRLEMRYSYSNTIVYNNFIWPNASAEHKQTIGRLAQAVLDARANYPGSSLADLYDPDFMPADLRKAHTTLDKAVEQAYNVAFNSDEAKIVSHLFELYSNMTS